jgi:hypothetical protein
MSKLEEVEAGAPAEKEETPPPVQAEAPNGASPQAAAEPDLRYYTLTEPIETGGRIKQKIERLLLDSTQLSYNDYMGLRDRYVLETPKEIRKQYDGEWEDPHFLVRMIVKLNPPMIDEDFRQVYFGDCPPLFRLASNLIFLKRLQKLQKTQSSS